MKPELLKMIDQLPMLPKTVTQVEKAYNNPNGGIEEMVEAIKSDPITTAFILKTANSPLYGLSRKVTEIEHAVSLLGKDTIRAFAMAHATNSTIAFDLSPYSISVEDYARRAQTINALITKWVSKVDRSMLSQLSLSSILSELGKVIISKYLISHKKSADFLLELNNAKSFREAEAKLVGASSEDITASLFFKWNFNPDIVHLVRYSNNPEDALDPDTMYMAKFLKISKISVDQSGNITAESIQKAEALLEQYELQREPFAAAITSITAVA